MSLVITIALEAAIKCMDKGMSLGRLALVPIFVLLACVLDAVCRGKATVDFWPLCLAMSRRECLMNC